MYWSGPGYFILVILKTDNFKIQLEGIKISKYILHYGKWLCLGFKNYNAFLITWNIYTNYIKNHTKTTRFQKTRYTYMYIKGSPRIIVNHIKVATTVKTHQDHTNVSLSR